MEKLKNLIIDTEKGIYQLNGEDIGRDVSELQLEFKDGKWSLMIMRDMSYTTSDT